MNADLRHIGAFLAVARLSSFTRAASALGVSQPTLTVQVRQFEEALGLRLFDRNNRRVALTPAGRDLVAPLERVMADLQAVTAHAHDVAGLARGTVAVAALPSIAAGLLPRAIQTLTARHHGILVRVRDVIAGRVIELVKGGEVEVGLGSLVRPDPALVAETIFTDRLCAFVPAGHPLADRREVRLRDLSRYPLVLTGHDSSVRQLVERGLEQSRVPAQVVQEVTYMSTAIGMVTAGLGIAILPESAPAPPIAGALSRVHIREPVLRRDIAILTRAGRSRSPAAQLLIDAVRDAVPTRRARGTARA